MTELTLFAKSGGPLTKRISLAADGSIISDGSCCLMGNGEARRVEIVGMGDLAALIEQLRVNEAIALGALRPGLQPPVQVVTKRKLDGAANTIARTTADISYRKGQPALALLDFDSKGMPNEVAAELRRHGGYWQALLAVLPELEGRGAAHPPLDQRRPVACRHRRRAARLRRLAHLSRGQGWH